MCVCVCVCVCDQSRDKLRITLAGPTQLSNQHTMEKNECMKLGNFEYGNELSDSLELKLP